MSMHYSLPRYGAYLRNKDIHLAREELLPDDVVDDDFDVIILLDL
jgi:hypothetical protein